MTLAQQSVVYDVAAAKIYPLTADTVSGGSPTYGAGVKLQGVATVMFDPNVVSATLKGDNGIVIARHGRTDMISATVTYGRLGLDAINATMGGGIQNQGAGSTETNSVSIGQPNTLPFFRLEAQITDLDNGIADVHLILWKAQIKSATFIDNKTDAFGQPKIDVEGIATLGAWAIDGGSSQSQIGTIRMYATATALA